MYDYVAGTYDFTLTEGDGEVDGVPLHSDYDGRGGSRVVFITELH